MSLTDPARLAALAATGLSGGAASEVLDRLARAATRLLGVPVALVSLVDGSRQSFAGLAGLTGWSAAERGTPLTHSVCRHVVERGVPLIVPDATAEPRLRGNLAIPDLGVRAYLGVPLTTDDGHTLGAMCAIDAVPHPWSDADVAALQDLAAGAIAELTLRRALATVAEQAAWLQAAAELSPQIPWVADPSGAILEVSSRWLAHTGMAADDVHGDAHGGAVLAAVHADDREPLHASWRHAVATGEPFDATYRLRASDGGYRWHRSCARPQRDAAGRILRWFGWIEDVHERVLAEREQARFALAARGSVDGLWSRDFRDGTVFISPRYRELLGYTDAEFPDSMAAFDALVHPDDRAVLDAVLAAHVESRAPFDLELRLRHRDGGWRWFWNRAHSEWADDGRPIRMVGSVSDVTARRAEQAARMASEARYRALLEAANDGICTTDADAVVTYANPRLAALLDYPASALVGRSYFDLLMPDEVDAARARFARLAERVADTREILLRRADGDAVPVLKASSTLVDDDGTFRGALFILSDLTAHRRAEVSLATSEARLAGIIASAMDAILTADADQRIVLANTAAERVFGYEPGTMVGLSLDTLVPAQARARHRDHVRRFRDDGTTTRAMGSPAGLTHAGLAGVRRDGTEFPIEASISQVSTAGGRFFTVILRDVTAQRAAEAERRQVEEALRRNEARYALAARATRNAIRDWDLVAGTVSWNHGAADVLGHPAAAIGGDLAWWTDHIHPDDRARVLAGMHRVIDDPDGAVEWQDRYRFRRADGRTMDIEDRGYVARHGDGRALRLVGAMEDVTATRQLEEQLRQAQKMEAVGQLAGGIAHDFNNLLTIIQTSLELATDTLPPEHEVWADLEPVSAAAERARTLVRQLLTFSRRQQVQPRLVRVGDVVRGAERLLRRVIGEEITFETAIDDDAAAVRVDPGQLEQVLMNLVVNARDAMLTPHEGHPGTGGTLSLHVAPATLTAAAATGWEPLSPGAYVSLTVRDTGHGMDEATLAHVFEPFFTTKEIGTGTGLGLATVHGIVRQAGGAIRLESTPGHGTTACILLPQSAGTVEGMGTAEASRPRSGAGQTILVVEDEAALRAIIRRALARRGFAVLEARHGHDALELWHHDRARIDALVTDVRMPEMGGLELVARVRADAPTLPVVFVSGYTDVGDGFRVGPHERFVEKPFAVDTLLVALGELLAPRGDRDG